MNKVFDKNINTRLDMILDDINNMFDSVAEMKANVLTVQYLLRAGKETQENVNKRP